ncbi:transposase [Sphingomonas melonis]
MRGERTVAQEALFYSFSLERHVPADHLLRSIDRFVDLSGIREELKPFYSDTGRPSIDPELMIRMLIIGYCMGIRSERRLCDEVHWNLAYRWFFRSATASRGLGYEAAPDGAVFLADAGAWLECSVEQEIAAGDHDIILFRLHRAATAEGIMPLVFHSSVFRTLTPIG